MNQQLDMNMVLQIIGAKEIEIVMLRDKVSKLEQELEAKGDALSKGLLSKESLPTQE